MSDASTDYHEPVEEMNEHTRDRHRGLVSLQEELEAVDWYQQRMDACRDPELRAILDHNREEEVEHAAMLLEWLRRRDPDFDLQLRDYLFTRGDIVAQETAATGGGEAQDDAPDASSSTSKYTLTIGSLKGGK